MFDATDSTEQDRLGGQSEGGGGVLDEVAGERGEAQRERERSEQTMHDARRGRERGKISPLRPRAVCVLTTSSRYPRAPLDADQPCASHCQRAIAWLRAHTTTRRGHRGVSARSRSSRRPPAATLPCCCCACCLTQWSLLDEQFTSVVHLPGLLQRTQRSDGRRASECDARRARALARKFPIVPSKQRTTMKTTQVSKWV